MHAVQLIISYHIWTIATIFHNMLHWLPITQCTECKTAPKTFSCIHCTRRVYFQNICQTVWLLQLRAMQWRGQLITVNSLGPAWRENT